MEWKGRLENRMQSFKDKVLSGYAGVLMELVIYRKMRMKLNNAKRIYEGI